MEGRTKGASVPARAGGNGRKWDSHHHFDYSQMAWPLPSPLPCSWVCCSEGRAKEKEQETSTTPRGRLIRHRQQNRRCAPVRSLTTDSCIASGKNMWRQCRRSSLLTDISGSFLPPLLGEFLSLLWAHRICREKKFLIYTYGCTIAIYWVVLFPFLIALVSTDNWGNYLHVRPAASCSPHQVAGNR